MQNIHINDDRKIKEIQDEFSEHFPNLKIEFYSKEHETGEGTPGRVIDPEHTIGEARTKQNEGDISINGHTKVSTLEENFHDIFGLNVQVFRKSGNVWLQTTVTDEWTLAEQNHNAEE
jgi:hypothetical protein